MNKKITSLVLLALTLSLVAGCASNGSLEKTKHFEQGEVMKHKLPAGTYNVQIESNKMITVSIYQGEIDIANRVGRVESYSVMDTITLEKDSVMVFEPWGESTVHINIQKQ